MKWLHLVEVVAPFVLQVIPGVPKDLIPIIVHAIQATELGAQPADTSKDKKDSTMQTISTAADDDKSVDLDNVSVAVDAIVGAVNALTSARVRIPEPATLPTEPATDSPTS